MVIDAKGVKAAAPEISMIKAIVPRMQVASPTARCKPSARWASRPTRRSRSLDACAFAALRDGPDEVHLRAIARREINRSKENIGAASAFLTPRSDRGVTARDID